MSSVEVNFDNFVWMLESGNFNQTTSGIVFNVSNTNIEYKSNIANKYQLEIITKHQGCEKPFDFKVINGRSKEGIEKLCQELKVIKNSKTKLLKIEDLDNVLSYSSKNILQKKKTQQSTLIVEDQNSLNIDSYSLFDDNSLKFILSKDDFKSIIDAYKKSSSILYKGVISLKVVDKIVYFVVGDVDQSKRFRFEICKTENEDLDVPLKFNLEVIQKIMKMFDEVEISYSKDMFGFFGKKQSEERTEIQCDIYVGNLLEIEEDDCLPF
jgi:hypothetical protein